jgi:4-amino-4-deoxy-L-arabinose transferase-like glycosyltransferase
MDSSKNLTYYRFGIGLVFLIYLILRFSYPETIEFGYDQPRLATRVLEYVENGKLFETQKFAEKAPWGNVSWGPALFYFYAPFLLITKAPLLISYLVAAFNLLSIAGIIYLGSYLFSKKAGLVAGFILATQPWWIIFSRMIYQPTPAITLIVISMILFFKTVKNPRSFYLSALIFSWLYLIEVYFHIASFVMLSALILFTVRFRRVFNKYLLIGLIASSVLVVPFFFNINKTDYLPVTPQTEEDRFKSGRDDPIARVKSIVPGYFKTISGGNMQYQLGYGTEQFYSAYPYFKIIEKSVILFIALIFIYHIICSVVVKDLRLERIALLVWSIAPILFLVFMPLANVPPIPRYFLLCFPAVSLLVGLFVSETYRLYKLAAIILVIPVVWIYFIYCYTQFIIRYDFPGGHLSVYSDTQYLFLQNAINKAIYHNNVVGNRDFILSSDQAIPTEFALDGAALYTLKHVYKIKPVINPGPKGYYVLDYTTGKEDPRFMKIGRFGPYSLYEFRDI